MIMELSQDILPIYIVTNLGDDWIRIVQIREKIILIDYTEVL